MNYSLNLIVFCFLIDLFSCLPRNFHRKFFGHHNLPNANLPDAQFYDQKLDHFDNTNALTWKQRYWINATYFNGTGPVFIMIGGEGEANPIWMFEGQWINYAQKYGALCVMLEHRFYGKSRPTDDLSVDNLRYLSSEQALADLASFRQNVTINFKLNDTLNKWISFGGSYPGSLSAWLRLKYPHLIHASVASSAPMLALVDFSDYLVVVQNSLEFFRPNCSAQISAATKQINQLIQDTNGRQVLQKLFQTCDTIVTDDDVTNFYVTLAGNFEGVVQYNKDNRAFEGAIDTNVTIEVVCNVMLDDTLGTPLERYAAVNTIILNTYGESCADINYNKSINELKETSWNSSASVGGRQWFWQTCTEFGFYQSTSSSSQPFGQTFSIEFLTKQCAQVFGNKYTFKFIADAVRDTNTNYGGYTYEGSNVLFVNGNIDPWHSLGFYQAAPNAQTNFVFINGTAHCADMYPSSHFDSSELEHARKLIEKVLDSWII